MLYPAELRAPERYIMTRSRHRARPTVLSAARRSPRPCRCCRPLSADQLDQEREAVQLPAQPVDQPRPPRCAVPPVASTSSTISTRCPGSIASAWISIASVPYSSWNASLIVCRRQLAGLADRAEPGAEPIGDRRAEDEAAALDADDQRDALVLVRRREAVERGLEPVRVAQQRRDVVEEDARLRKVRHRTDSRFQCVHVVSYSGQGPDVRRNPGTARSAPPRR